MRKTYLLFIGLLSLPTLSFADDIQNNANSPTNPAPQSFLSNFQYSGYLDSSYNYLQQSNKFISGTDDRYNDLEPNGFTLQQAAITLSDQPTQGFGGLLNLIGGRDANSSASYGYKPSTEFDSQTAAIDVVQAFLQYAKNSFTTIGGKINSLAGIEGTDPTEDYNFSRGILYGYATPGSLLGIRTTYAVNEKLSLIAGVNNGWDNVRDFDRRKTIELGIAETVNSLFSFSVQGYSGEERATPLTATGPIGTRNLIDAIATLKTTEKLTFAGEYTYGMQTTATLPSGITGEAVWTGFAGYANYKFNDQWHAAIRGEYFADEDGFRTGVAQDWKELTFTVGYSPIKAIELRAETRHDFSNVDSFVGANGVTVHNNQQSYALEGVYKF